MTTPMPRDDRAISRSSLVISWVFIGGFIAGASAVVATARPEAHPVLVAACFLVVAAAQLWSLTRGLPFWMEGRPVPGRVQLVQVAIFLGSFAFLLLGGHEGLAALLGALTGLFAMSPASVVLARRNRAVVDGAWADRSTSRSRSRAAAGAGAGAGGQPPLRRATGRRARIGEALAMSLASARARATAWAVATVVGCLVAGVGSARLGDDGGGGGGGGASLAVTLAVGMVFLGFALREAWGVHRARRAYVAGRRTPRVGWVALLHDPNPRVHRPLLAIWDEEPVSGPGTFPRPDRVFRADDESDDLESYQGAMTVHEAWIDGVESRWATPRWVAADGGLAIPHRPALLGRWYFGAITSAERADAEPLTLDEPHSQHEPLPAGSPSSLPSLKAVAWRAGVLSAFALVLVLVGSP